MSQAGGDRAEVVGGDGHVNVRRPHGDQERDQAAGGGVAGGGDEETDAAGEFGDAADGDEHFGVTELRWHDRGEDLRVREVAGSRGEEECRWCTNAEEEVQNTPGGA